MKPFADQAASGFVSSDFAAQAFDRWSMVSRILILVDGRISVDPDQGDFGISTAIGQLRNFADGFSSFVVTVATRDGTGEPMDGYDITGFRFTKTTLAQFDQVWMFGIWPDPGGDHREGADATIDDPMYNPTSDAELRALSGWMDAGGGVFATGDHFILGASMCHRVPRVAHMRAWTVATGVTGKYETRRYETTRPGNIFAAAGLLPIDYPSEEDRTPQRIEWVPHAVGPATARPHPLLCHPQLGPIDVLPDHMHEGRCFDFESGRWQVNHRDATFKFGGFPEPHFPTKDGVRVLPEVVAWGTTLRSPPLWFAEGPQAARRFPMIAAYDGLKIGLGRVVTDSTWHHWFDLNVSGMVATANQTGNRESIDKIFRYWVNVAIWLSAPDFRLGMVLGWLKQNQFGFFGRQVISLSDDAVTLGRAALRFLDRNLGPCVVRDLLHDLPRDPGRRAMSKMLAAGRPETGLDPETVTAAIAGKIVRAAYSDDDHLRRQIAAHNQIRSTPLFDDLYARARDAAQSGFDAAVAAHRNDLMLAVAELSDLTIGRAAAS